MSDEQAPAVPPENSPATTNTVTRISENGRDLFPSLVAMRQVHRDLLRLYRSQGNEDPALIEQVVTFVNEACATGVLIDAEEDRWAAQGLVDYWTTVLYRLGRESVDTTLDDFDASRAPELPDEVCPYLGLGAFGEEQQDRFFGRDRLIDDATNELESHSFVAVVGPSGSGKSSLVLAGLLPALKSGVVEGSDEWLYLEPMTPSASPLVRASEILFGSSEPEVVHQLRRGPEVLYNQLTRLAEDAHVTTAVLFIDEFEELFTLCTDENIRNDFIANLIAAFDRPQPRHKLIMAMHSDYENQVGRWPRLKKIFTLATVRVTPPTAVELREVITRPASAVGLRFEDGLIERLLQDVSGERIALPLLQFTLLNLWDNRDRNRITWDAYNKVGGGRASLVAKARQFYADLSANDKLIAQRLLMALVDPGNDMGVDLLRVTRDELLRAGGNRERIEPVLNKIVAYRLVRLIPGDAAGQEQYEIVHEALTQDWPELVEWLDEKRFEQRQRLRLRAAAQQWQTTGHDVSALWRGALLQEAKRYSDLNDLEQSFLDTSVEAEEARERAREVALQREIEQAKMLAEAQRREAEAERERAETLEKLTIQTQKSNRRLIVLVIILMVIGTMTLILAGVAFNERNQANAQTQMAQTSEAQAVEARSTAVAALNDAQTSAQEARAALRLAQDNARTAAEALEAVRLSEQQAQEALATAVAAQETAQASAAEAQRQSELARSGQIAAQA
ncbi:MAG: hypothetical protein KDD89_08190, partial [Anaerolineales bacterium]|nr:hypothetical protein [Anaerolineales bacterium]